MGLKDKGWERSAGQKFSKEETLFIQTLTNERKRRRITQEDLAKKAGLDQAAVGRLEAMGGNPTLKTIVKILNAMDMQLKIVDKE
ncbi:hypothetical protein BTO30_00700 [Domibacillus antri]|uniref:HTH cro/C1-type domain-containing protein n=1 Tax=Domibacillus antri TaxID=1714264 RepID=A0A1Q8Q9M7_9BACI|nr:helix-turn-helix transcriptional regulator [Domibacillus antri]OLN23975.1 hypothetical protein BTO30_00700 [Domibacillus antri]